MKRKEILYGGDYNPEQWLKEPEILEKDIVLMKEEGITQPTTVNLMYDYQQLNYDELAKCVDVVSWDAYPVWHKGGRYCSGAGSGDAA